MVAGPGATTAGKRTRWARRTGYVAFAWVLLFAAAHVYWAFGGTVLLGEKQGQSAEILFARDPWSYVAGWTILSLMFVFAGLFPLALVWAGGTRIGRSTVQTGVVSLGYAGMILLALFGLATQEIGLVLFGSGVCALGGRLARSSTPQACCGLDGADRHVGAGIDDDRLRVRIRSCRPS